MKFIYSLRHYFTAYFIVATLCLQSCSGFNKPTIPFKQGNLQPIQATPALAYNQASFDNKFLSQEGHLVIFYLEGTQLKAAVKEKPYHGFSRQHHLPVSIEQGKRMDQVMNCATDQPNPLIHVHLPTDDEPGLVYIRDMGSMGVGNMRETKEKETEDEWQEKLSDTAPLASLASEKIVSETSDGVIRNSLHMAALNGDLATVRSLLLQGYLMNVRDQFGCTPLYLAASKGHTEIVRLLLEEGADTYAVDYNGLSALHVASFHGQVQAVKMLLQRTNVNIQDKVGYSPLFLATRSRHVHIVSVLINSGADVNARNKLGNTPLYEAVRRADLDIVKLLCDKGADVNVQNIYGWTSLHLAVGGGEEIINCLITRGADINIKNDDGLTPFQLSILERQLAKAI